MALLYKRRILIAFMMYVYGSGLLDIFYIKLCKYVLQSHMHDKEKIVADLYIMHTVLLFTSSFIFAQKRAGL